jgi:hypothetical protein
MAAERIAKTLKVPLIIENVRGAMVISRERFPAIPHFFLLIPALRDAANCIADGSYADPNTPSDKKTSRNSSKRL